MIPVLGTGWRERGWRSRIGIRDWSMEGQGGGLCRKAGPCQVCIEAGDPAVQPARFQRLV